jgi:hypothetical protein
MMLLANSIGSENPLVRAVQRTLETTSLSPNENIVSCDRYDVCISFVRYAILSYRSYDKEKFGNAATQEV